MQTLLQECVAEVSISLLVLDRVLQGGRGMDNFGANELLGLRFHETTTYILIISLVRYRRYHASRAGRGEPALSHQDNEDQWKVPRLSFLRDNDQTT